MCDMQKMPAREDASCEEDSEMNFAAFSAVGSPGTHFVTTGGQLPVAKLQQNVAANGSTLQQVVGMVGDMNVGVQYVRPLDGGATLQTTPQLISVPIALPGAKPGDPQPTVQIQVLNPGLLQQQQPKYQMQIPIQGFQQGGAVLTLAYSPDANEAGGIQLLGNALPDGLQVVTMPQEMQLVQPQQTHNQSHDKEQQIHHQVFITPNQQIIINNLDDNKVINNNTCSDNNNASMEEVVVKEECDDNTNDDESSQGTEASDSMSWQVTGSGSQMELIKYLNTLQPQQTQGLPVSLQQFLRLNPATDGKKVAVEIEIMSNDEKASMSDNAMDEESAMRIQNNAGVKKKKKYKKKPSKPARPKPGQVVIATAADGTNIFCCPECQMAYPEKEQLEMHLIVHKIERRFICGICGAGLKRKEHLERHKLGHNPERPFVCGVCRKGFKRREHLNLHAVIHSGVKTEMCKECGKGFYRKDHLRKHTRSHEHKRARDEAALASDDIKPNIVCNNDNNNILPEITIHVPTGGNVNVPVQINIPQHVVSSLAAAQAHAQGQQQQQQQLQQQQHQNNSDAQSQLDALLAQHT